MCKARDETFLPNRNVKWKYALNSVGAGGKRYNRNGQLFILLVRAPPGDPSMGDPRKRDREVGDRGIASTLQTDTSFL